MGLNLMYITNDPTVAVIAEKAGVDRIFVDMEYIGKSARQGGMDTVQHHHTTADVRRIRACLSEAELLVRINPIHKESGLYTSSEEEINDVIQAGADFLMLPYFKTVEEVKEFIRLVNGRAKTMLLLETPEAVEIVEELFKLDGIDQIHIGLNDLSLGYKKKFMFQLFIDGTVESLCEKFREKQITFGIGGIASLGKGMLPAEYIIREHYRLGSTCAILSRSFCNTSAIQDYDEIRSIFVNGVKEIRDFEKECEHHPEKAKASYEEMREIINHICS